jgi:5-methylcytosine-specific restriction protein B
MARIRSLAPSHGDSRVHPTEVDCGWQVLRTADGTRLLQLSTYGSDDRQSQPKVSQTIQLDRDVARQLVQVLQETFNL